MGVWGITVVKVFLFPFQEFVSIDKNSTDLSQKGWVDSSNSLCCPFYLYQLSLFDMDTSFTWTVIDNIYALTIDVEKKNDDLRRYFHGQINRWDAANNLHLVEKWQEALQGQQRVNLMSLQEQPLILAGGWQTGSHKKGAKSINAASRGYTSPCPSMTEDILKPKVSELISLVLVKTGRTVNKKTLKQDLIKALLNLETRAEWLGTISKVSSENLAFLMNGFDNI